MLKRACFEIAVISPSLIFNRIETWEKYLTYIVQHNRCLPCFDDVINKMFAFLTNKVPFFSYISNAFLTQIRRKYVIFVIPAKNKVICDSESIYIDRFLLTKLVVLLTSLNFTS